MDMNLVGFGIGDIASRYAGKEGTLVDVNDSGILLLLRWDGWKREELEALKSGSGFKMYMTKLYGVIFMEFKVGGMQWMDAPYSGHLSRGLNNLEDVADGTGYAVHVIGVDTSGRVMGMRTVGASTAFSRKLKHEIMNQITAPFSRAEHDRNIMRVYGAYSTKDLVKFADVGFSIAGE